MVNSEEFPTKTRVFYDKTTRDRKVPKSGKITVFRENTEITTFPCFLLTHCFTILTPAPRLEATFVQRPLFATFIHPLGPTFWPGESTNFPTFPHMGTSETHEVLTTLPPDNSEKWENG